MNPRKVPPERIRKAADELLVLVRARLPERFYQHEPRWRSLGTAFIARMAGTVETMVGLAGDGRQMDSAVLLRSLYEHMVTFAWISIDPEPRIDRWFDDQHVELRKLHHDAALFGMTVLDAAELKRAKEAKELPPLIVQADEVDTYWAPLSRGFRAHPAEGPKNLLTVRGLYPAVYRVASRSAHAQPQSLEGCMQLDRYPAVVDFERDDETFLSFLAVPIFAMALLVSAHRLGWPDEDMVGQINEALAHDVEPDA
jgi:hypothetical protein